MQGMSNYEELLKEWQSLFQREEDYYLYGAANMAKDIIRLSEETGVLRKIKGCLVTNKKDNPDYVADVPVIDVHNIEDKSAVILVPHGGVYKREIAELLEILGFKNVVYIRHYGRTLTKKEVVQLNDKYMQTADEKINKMRNQKSTREIELDMALCDRIIKLREEKQPDFSEEQFYQSFELIGLSGRRPTMYRIEKYGVERILSPEKTVLDIGCNAGFFDMAVAPRVKHVLGVEYDATMVEVANIVKEYIHAENCEFWQGDFCEWMKQNHNTYNVIFSFAIHHWLNVSQEEYVQMLDELLEVGGHICIESHELSVVDLEYDRCIELFLEKGYECINEGEIMDDGAIRRKYMTLYKRV